MLAMQYTIQLPVDYDMKGIEARVEERKPLFNNVPGLVHKSYLANFDDKIYAPFYIWDDIARLRDFLLDDLFHGVTTSFNRPRVRLWTVLSQVRGPLQEMPTYAVRESDPILTKDPLEALFEHEKEQQRALQDNPALYLSVLGLDPDRWEFLRYHLWKDEESAAPKRGDITHRYTVLHA